MGQYELYGVFSIYAVTKPFGTDKLHLRLGVEKKRKYVKTMEEHYGKGNVYLPGYVIHPSVAAEKENVILGMAEAFFEDNVSVRLGILEEQEVSPDANLVILFIPFVIRRENVSDPLPNYKDDMSWFVENEKRFGEQQTDTRDGLSDVIAFPANVENMWYYYKKLLGALKRNFSDLTIRRMPS